jgi:hypothetical protein
LHHSEVRAGARLSYVEAAPGVIIVLPTWILDPGACGDMTLGAPRIDVVALKHPDYHTAAPAEKGAVAHRLPMIEGFAVEKRFGPSA